MLIVIDDAIDGDDYNDLDDVDGVVVEEESELIIEDSVNEEKDEFPPKSLEEPSTSLKATLE